ncbi:MAG: hypothetical protein NUW01_04480 [Gemmatimonadaceae bacterium]|nr:hypothetical protein [Gemmatimonadaceae bacterium]
MTVTPLEVVEPVTSSNATNIKMKIKPPEPTEYVVLLAHDDEGSEGRWDRVGPPTVLAASAAQAVLEVAGKRTAHDQAGCYVAVPVRSWKPVIVTPEVQTKLKLESA